MSHVNPIWLEGQRKRLQRHDWQRWIRHDAHRFMTERKRAEEAARREADEAADAAEQEQFEQELLQVRRDLAALKLELALSRVGYKYNPDQPRSPKGNPDGGQWVRDSGKDPGRIGTSRLITELSAARRRSGVSEADCDNQYRRDSFVCNLVHTPLCWQQASERYGACLAGRPLPPLNF
jgi:hypothetical protein